MRSVESPATHPAWIAERAFCIADEAAKLADERTQRLEADSTEVEDPEVISLCGRSWDVEGKTRHCCLQLGHQGACAWQ